MQFQSDTSVYQRLTTGYPTFSELDERCHGELNGLILFTTDSIPRSYHFSLAMCYYNFSLLLLLFQFLRFVPY